MCSDGCEISPDLTMNPAMGNGAEVDLLDVEEEGKRWRERVGIAMAVMGFFYFMGVGRKSENQ